MKKQAEGSLVIRNRFLAKVWRQKYLFLMVLPGFLAVLIFNYFPMYGILIAFKDYSPVRGILGSEWVGLQHFQDFFNNPMAFRILKNTLILGVYNLLWSFPVPVILALLFNELKNKIFKKVVQTVSYFPNFISVVIVAGMLTEFCSREGLFNQIVRVFGGEPVTFLLEPKYFRTIFIASGIWQSAGFGTIIYLAALSGVDPTLYDVANIDGAGRWQQMLNISLPALKPTMVILLIFSVSGILGSDFQKIILLYNPDTYEVADVIGSYTYREGVLGARFEYATAIGLFMSVISFILLSLANLISRKVAEVSLW